MSAPLLIRMTAPIVVTSLLFLAAGVGTAWYVERWQTSVSRDLRVNVAGIRAAEELEILVREARTRLDHFLITGDPAHVASVPELHASVDQWLAEAERWAVTPTEARLMGRVRQGSTRFWRDLEGIRLRKTGKPLVSEIHTLIDDVLVREMLDPAHEYLDFNEEEVRDAIDRNQVFGDRLVYALLLLGFCGSGAGLLAGFGFARALRRSLVQLSVLVQDTAGHLAVCAEPIRYAGGNLAVLEDALRLVAEQVKTMVERLQQREREAMLSQQMAAVGQLAAGMAHELRNPLTSMKILVQGALADGSEEDDDVAAAGRYLSVRELSVLEEEILRLEQLLQSFLDFARPPKLERQVRELRPLLEQTAAFLEARAAALSARIEIVAPAEPICAEVDAGQLRQVLLNLLLNALDAMATGGTVLVVLQSEGAGWLRLHVADEGMGLPAALGERIFEPFITSKEAGLGLGLSICKRIVAAHGGTLECKNRASGGAVFTVRLPRMHR